MIAEPEWDSRAVAQNTKNPLLLANALPDMMRRPQERTGQERIARRIAETELKRDALLMQFRKQFVLSLSTE